MGNLAGVAEPKQATTESAAFHLRLPCEPTSVPRARARVRDWVRRQARIGRDLLAEIQLAVTEAATNAVRHSGCADFEVHGWISGDAVIVAVWDQGQGGRDPNPGSGLGTKIIRELAESVEVVHTQPGTRITMRFPGLRTSSG